MKKWYFALVVALFCVIGIAAADTSEELENASPEYITETYRKALKAFSEGDYEGSLKYIRHVIKSNFADFRLRILAGHNHWRLGNYDKAILHLATLAEISPEQPAAYSNLAALYLQLGQVTKAATLLKQGEIKLKAAGVRVPPRYLNLQARAALAQSQPAEALRYITAAKAAYSPQEDLPEDKWLALMLEGRALLATGQTDKAVFALEWAASMANNDPYCNNLLGVAYLQWSKTGSEQEKKDKREKARKTFESVLSGQAPDSLKTIVRKNLEKLAG